MQNYSYYKPVSKEFSLISKRNYAEYPNFMNFILPLDSFDPFIDTEMFSNHLYDDLDHPLFDHYLQRVVQIDKKNDREKDKEKEGYEEEDNQKFQKENETLIVKILNLLFEKTTITTKWGYELKDYFIVNVFQKKNKKKKKIYIKCCLQRPSRVYGRIVDLQFIYDMHMDEIDVFFFKLSGTVPQQYINFIHGTF